jgi:hypothetical protein
MNFLLALLILSSPAANASVSCSGSINIPGGFLNGSCAGASCNAYMPSGYVSGSGYCDGGQSVQVDGYRQGGFANGQCNGSSISLYLPSEYIQLRGTCSNGGSFSGEAQTYGGFANGTCMENGSFNAYLSGGSFSFRGSCN